MKFNIFKFYVDFRLKKYSNYPKLEKLDVNIIDTILVFSNTAIGDTLFNTPVLRALKEEFPNKKVIVLLNPVNYKLFENNIYIDEIILYDGKWKNFFKVLKELKKYKIDLSLILHSNEPQATPLAVLSDSKYIIKIPNNKTEYNIYHNNEKIGPYHDRHGIFDRLRFLEYININNTDPRMELFINNENKKDVNDFFIDNGINKEKDILIGFQVGASTISRMWFNDKWIELGSKLLNSDKNIKIILTGSPSENVLTSNIFTSLNNSRVYNLAGKFNIKSAAVLIGKIDIFITPDTGPLHIAAALKTPTVTLFAAAKWYVSNPCFDEDIHLYIQKDRTCEPCIGKSCKFQECMLQISVNEVYEKVNLLKNRNGNAD